MRMLSSVLAALFLVTLVPAAHAQTVTAQTRERAIAKCKANRGTDCTTEAGLREWIDAERNRPPGQRSAIMEQKLEAARQAQQQGNTKAAPR
jgi:hypothetical protein